MIAPVGDYSNKYTDRRFVIVGKGPTRFQFENLRGIEDPIIFINDAVQFERFADRSIETFFFAHDAPQKVWITPKLKSTPVVPRAGATDSGAGQPMLDLMRVSEAESLPKIVTYEWGGWYDEDDLRKHTREEIAQSAKLYLNSGTIHTAIHFAWLCGASKITFIGCDGFTRKYDRRIDLKSHSTPLGVFGKIRQVQDRLCDRLGPGPRGIDTEYVNEPRLDFLIPAIAHSIWFGDIPEWARENIELFRSLHPSWQIKLWRDVPDNMPNDLVKAAVDAEQYSSRSDILSYWLLYTYGGVYLDCDMLTLRSMEPLRRYEAFACVQHDGRVNCAAMGSIPRSRGMDLILQAVREVSRRPGPKHRTAYGPKLLTDLFGKGGAWPQGQRSTRHLAVVPRHYFYLLVDQKQAHPFWKADEAGRKRIIEANKTGISDPTSPYAVHLWGVDGSSKRKGFVRGDALGYRLRSLARDRDRIVGAEVGVLAGRLSEHILRLVPNLHLYMVDRWCAVSPHSRYAESGDSAAKLTDAEMQDAYHAALERTEFAKHRRIVIRAESTQAAQQVPDGSLDFVFIDADHTYDGVSEDLHVWYPKVRAGGLVCGHDMDNPLGNDKLQNAPGAKPLWGVRKGVEDFMKSNCPGSKLELGGEYTWYFTRPLST